MEYNVCIVHSKHPNTVPVETFFDRWGVSAQVKRDQKMIRGVLDAV